MIDEEKLDSAETLEEVEQAIKESVAERQKPMNRAQRRALMKKGGKTGRQQLSTLTETVKRISYVDLIQKLQALNEKRENEQNEDSTEND